jgi:hypothetical protein
MSYITESCPKCYSTYGMHFGPNSGLGPSTFVCSTCGETFQSGRREWVAMGRWSKLWYLLISVAYIVVVGFSAGVVFDDAARQIFALSNPRTVPPSGPVFWSVAIFFGLATAALQALRVRWSAEKALDGDQAPVTPSFLSWKTNLHFLWWPA